MDVGLALPQYDYSVPGESSLSWATVEAWADRAVALGFTSLWVSDHLFLSLEKYGGPATRYGCFDPLVALSSLAVRHPATTLGCLVFCAQLRPPRVLARQLETLDALAPAPLVAGFGAGWYEPEFEVAGIEFAPPATRLRQLVEAAGSAKAHLRDAGRDVAVWFGGKGDRLVELAARHADGWNTVWSWEPDAYRRKLDVAERACVAAGRDPGSLTRSLGLATLVGETEDDVSRRWRRRRESVPPGILDGTDLDAWRSGKLVGTVEEVREQVGVWEALGVSTLVVNLGALPFSVTDTDDLDLVASALIQERNPHGARST
ncbi:MAG TPA: LLM class flavin-dependent oxidoreductase [Acidimicrobiales bacterium]|nr:LLM class flavin-dependent oxidoreductase [Acidimicrobiales bacterium]